MSYYVKRGCRRLEGKSAGGYVQWPLWRAGCCVPLCAVTSHREYGEAGRNTARMRRIRAGGNQKHRKLNRCICIAVASKYK